MLISVIIPAFNEERLLRQTLDRIKLALNENQNDHFSWEIIVCDNNSTDRTAEVASQMGAKMAFEPINQISRARNTGAGIAQGDWFLFILHYILPHGLIKKLGSKLLGYWYDGCR